MYASHIVFSTKHSYSRWCPSPSQVLPAFHREMGGCPGRCPSHRFPGPCDLRSRPHLAAEAAMRKQLLLSAPTPCLCSEPAVPSSSTAELPLSSWGHGRKEPAHGCPLCLPYAWDSPATWGAECGDAAGFRRNGPQRVGSPGCHKPKGSSLFLSSQSFRRCLQVPPTGKGKPPLRFPGRP